MSQRNNMKLALMQMRRNRGNRGLPRWAGWLVFGIPVLFTVLGIGAVVEAVIFAADAESTRGEVLSVERSYDSEGAVSYTPLIRYRTGDGQSVEAETHMSSSGYDYAIGERVEILYSYANPETVRINSFFSLYGFGLIFGGIGAIFVAVLTLTRKKMFGSREDSGIATSMEREAEETWRRSKDTAAKPEPEPEPRTTDPSQYGHVHKPKPKRTPTIRRMR